jgi:hypothetical protein
MGHDSYDHIITGYDHVIMCYDARCEVIKKKKSKC